MTVDSRIKTTTGVLLLFVLGIVWILFWSSRLVERRHQEDRNRLASGPNSFHAVGPYERIHGSRDRRALRQWEKHRELFRQILNEMNSESMTQNCWQIYGTVFMPSIPFSSTHAMTPKEGDASHDDRRVKDMLNSLMLLRLENW